MRKFALLLVALCLVVAMSGDALAQTTHTVAILNSQTLQPIANVHVAICVQFGIDDEEDWSCDDGGTDGNGQFSYQETPHSTATYWYVVVLGVPNGYEMPIVNPTNVNYSQTWVTIYIDPE